MMQICQVGSVTHQPASNDKLTHRIGCRNHFARGKGCGLRGAAGEKYVGSGEEGIGAFARDDDRVLYSYEQFIGTKLRTARAVSSQQFLIVSHRRAH
jgi:hypothetical protein